MSLKETHIRTYIGVVVDFTEFPESTAVAVPHCLSIAEGLKKRVGWGEGEIEGK